MASYGKMQVTKLDQLDLANYTKRTFEISEVNKLNNYVDKFLKLNLNEFCHLSC